MDLLNTNEAAKKLNVTAIRVRQLIREGKLDAHRIGRDYVIAKSDLEKVKTYGKAGRPLKKVEKKNTNKKPFKTIFDIAPELIGSLNGKHDSLPKDLSSNKKYLRDLGRKSAEKRGLLERG